MTAQPESKIRALCHEAGHVVAGHLLGVTIEAIKVENGKPCVLSRMNGEDCDAHRVFCAAGRAVEELSFGDYDKQGFASDKSRIQQGAPNVDVMIFVRRAKELLAPHQPKLKEFAVRLHCRYAELKGNFDSNAPEMMTETLMDRQEIEGILQDAER